MSKRKNQPVKQPKPIFEYINCANGTSLKFIFQLEEVSIQEIRGLEKFYEVMRRKR